MRAPSRTGRSLARELEPTGGLLVAELDEDGAQRVISAAPSSRDFAKEWARQNATAMSKQVGTAIKEALGERWTGGGWAALTKATKRLFGRGFYGYRPEGTPYISTATLAALRRIFGLDD